MEAIPFAIEYHSDTPELTDELKAKTEKRLYKLTKRHRDVTGASVAVVTDSGDTQPRAYRVRVVLYQRPDNIAAVSTAPLVSTALKDALDAAERQVRTQRTRLRETWKRA